MWPGRAGGGEKSKEGDEGGEGERDQTEMHQDELRRWLAGVASESDEACLSLLKRPPNLSTKSPKTG